MSIVRTAIKRPIPITVVQIETETDLAACPAETSLTYREGDLHELQVWNHLHGNWITFRLGDYLNISSPGDVYPIEQGVFASTYDLVEGS